MKQFKKALFLSLLLIGALSSCGTMSSSVAAASTSASSTASAASTAASSVTSTGASSTSHQGGPGSGGQPGGTSTATSTSHSGATTYSSDTTTTDQTYSSTTADENAVLVTGGNVVLNNPTISKTGNGVSSADNANFYGYGASLLCTGGNAYVKNGTINSTVEGGAGLFAYGDGTVYASGTTISTTDNCAGGVHVAGGGTLYAWDLNATTVKNHSAAIRSDRGGGTMYVSGGTFASTANDSPAIYSTADITVKGITGSSTYGESTAIEGKNSVSIFNSTITGAASSAGDGVTSSYDNTWGVILYQSMSGDSETGTSLYRLVDSTLDIQKGGFFYSTNTSSKFLLQNATLKHTDNDSYAYLIRATGSARWGSGTGPTMNFTASNQTMSGKVVYDTVSALDLYLKDSSVWTGATEINTGFTGSKTSSLHIENGSKWVVNGDSTWYNIDNAGTIVDASGNTVTIKKGSSTLVQGTSSYTVTITGTYATTGSMTDAVASASVSDYDTQFTKPSQLA
jgi:flagellar basal body rod protein FlgB